jgi:hypothetical protein
MTRFHVASLASMFATFALAGCSAAIAPTDDPSQTQAALDTDNGGLTTAAETPMFGDPNVAQLPEFVGDYADPQDMTVEAAKVQGAKRYHLAVIWGHLPPAHDADEIDAIPQIMDWTGSLSVDAGAIGVKRALAFDGVKYGDKLLPRNDAQTVSFVSHTLPHVDGLFVSVILPPNASPMLHFRTKSLSTDIDLSTLALKPGSATRLDDSRNGMFTIGYQDDGCARGLVFGRWMKMRPALGGFRGVVMNGEGAGIGHIRGIWGHSVKKNENLFFGKYIDRNGDFRGLLGGKYGLGVFGGVWGTVDPKNVGGLEGYYSDGYERGDGRGVFLGRWAEKCVR